jgi:hypothetical protein
MLARNRRLLVVLTLVIAPLVSLAVPGFASAAQRERFALRKGVFDGLWHNDPVQIIIERINPDGSFKGELHFDPHGRWGDVRTGITGHLGRDDSLTMERDDCGPGGQVARTGRPEVRGRSMVWRGEVTGPDFKERFELRVPLR